MFNTTCLGTTPFGTRRTHEFSMIRDLCLNIFTALLRNRRCLPLPPVNLCSRKCRRRRRRSENAHAQQFQHMPLNVRHLNGAFDTVSGHGSTLSALAYLTSVLSGEIGAPGARLLAQLMSGKNTTRRRRKCSQQVRERAFSA